MPTGWLRTDVAYPWVALANSTWFTSCPGGPGTLPRRTSVITLVGGLEATVTFGDGEGAGAAPDGARLGPPHCWQPADVSTVSAAHIATRIAAFMPIRVVDLTVGSVGGSWWRMAAI